MRRRKITVILLALLAVIMCLTGCEALKNATEKESTPTEKAAVTVTASAAAPEKGPVVTGPIIEPQAIADYLFEHGTLPDNFITKNEAKALGWDSSRNYVSDVAPGKSIGGDYFANREKILPDVRGRTYREADCWYTEGKRRGERIVYSSDGHVWYTEDHYQTFTELFPSGQEE